MKSINKLGLSVQFFLAALLIFAFTQGVWVGLLNLNLKTNPQFPWFFLAMGLILFALWKYLNGDLWPGNNPTKRRNYLRARLVPKSTFFWATMTGVFSIGALAGLWIILSQIFRLPGNITLQNIANVPSISIIAALIMGALVSALAEEFAFRGYLQVTLERNFGGLTAVLVQAILISPLHGVTQGFTWPILLWYFLADLIFGTMAYLTDSILPGIIIHSAGLLFFFTVIWPHAARITAAAPNTLILAITCLFVLFSILGFVKLRKLHNPVS